MVALSMHKTCVLAERKLLWRGDYYTLSRDGPIGARRFVWVGESSWAPFVARARLVSVRDFHGVENSIAKLGLHTQS